MARPLRTSVYATTCRYCGARIAFLPETAEYRAASHGPVNTRGVLVDLDGRPDVHGFDLQGIAISGARIVGNPDGVQRCTKVWLRHHCDAHSRAAHFRRQAVRSC